MAENIFHDQVIQKITRVFAFILSIVGYILIAFLILQWLVH